MNDEKYSLPEELYEIGKLIEKYIDQEITGDEKIILDAWINESDENKRLFDELTTKRNIRKRVKQIHEISQRMGTAKGRARRDILGEGSAVKPIRVSWKKWVAAAAIISVIATGGYFWFIRDSHNEIASTETRQFKNDKAPGTNGAILKLASGEQIVLDSAANGDVAKQGKTRITKSGGLIAYISRDQAPKKVLYNTLVTPRGRQFQLVLPDGSKVWLNAASSIVFPAAFSGSERKVQITGEAYFEVTHDETKPFIVSANGTEVQVLGTHFNVNAYSDETGIKTTLLEGSVRVVKNNKAIIIKPGEQTQVTGNDIKVVNSVDLDAVVAWKNGLIVFNGADIKTILRQISRWYDVDVEYEGEVSAPEIFGKIPRSVNLSDVLKALEINSKLHFEIEGNKIVVEQ